MDTRYGVEGNTARIDTPLVAVTDNNTCLTFDLYLVFSDSSTGNRFAISVVWSRLQNTFNPYIFEINDLSPVLKFFICAWGGAVLVGFGGGGRV